MEDLVLQLAPCDFCGAPQADLYGDYTNECFSCDDFFWYQRRLRDGVRFGHVYGPYDYEQGMAVCYECGISNTTADEELIECQQDPLKRELPEVVPGHSFGPHECPTSISPDWHERHDHHACGQRPDHTRVVFFGGKVWVVVETRTDRYTVAKDSKCPFCEEQLGVA